MDYSWHYDKLIYRAKMRDLSGYSEKHHIVPRCLGGVDDHSNLVRLTAEEHYVAHQLLVKMHPESRKLLWALSAMTHATKRMGRSKNKRYGWLRDRFAAAMRDRFVGKPLSDEHRAKLSEAAKKRKRPHSAAAKANMSAAAKGREKSPEHIAAISAAKTGVKMPPRSQEWNENHAAALRRVAKTRDLSFTQSPEYRAKQAAKMREIWAERRARKLKG